MESRHTQRIVVLGICISILGAYNDTVFGPASVLASEHKYSHIRRGLGSSKSKKSSTSSFFDEYIDETCVPEICNTDITENIKLSKDYICPGTNSGIKVASGVTLDCDGYVIGGTSSTTYNNMGVILYEGAALKNCHVEGFYVGLNIQGSHTKIENVKVTNNDYGFNIDDNNTEVKKVVVIGNNKVGMAFNRGSVHSVKDVISCGNGGNSDSDWYVHSSVQMSTMEFSHDIVCTTCPSIPTTSSCEGQCSM